MEGSNAQVAEQNAAAVDSRWSLFEGPPSSGADRADLPLPLAARDRLTLVLDDALADLRQQRHADGHWLFEFEADVTISAEYILLNHFLGEIDPPLEAELASYIRKIQGEDGGWPLFYGGDADLSATVKAYLALKLTGEDIEAPHMRRARAVVLERGGAERCNVFTLYALALFEQVPWRATPVMPVEMVLQPAWSPFSLFRMSYWSRTVIVPLLIMASLKPRARNPRNVSIRELFKTPPEEVEQYLRNPTGRLLGNGFLIADRLMRRLEPHVPTGLRKRALTRARAFIAERMNGEHGLGAIFPAMANCVMALDAMGYPRDHPDVVTGRRALERLLIRGANGSYCQPCLSPVWDTGLALHAVIEASGEPDRATCDWLIERQIIDERGDWALKRPAAEPGGWAFQYENPCYPDIDDTAVVAMALHRADPETYQEPILRAVDWLLAMQSRNGGWASFDVDNTAYHLNHIPFADHGALLDPPTADLTGRVIGFLGQLGWRSGDPPVARGLRFLERTQEDDGSWFGRWGTNYIYGTWSVLAGLNAVGMAHDHPMITRAAAWLLERQRADGGWGEDGATYWDHQRHVVKASTPSQTAWALLGLMAAGRIDEPAVDAGVRFLLEHPRRGCLWDEPWYTAVGFPRVFYVRYHGYARYFPLWALARYRHLKRTGSRQVAWGI